jgi:hypothetical protein
MRKLVLAASLLVPLLTGCAAAAIGVGAGVIASQEMLDNDTYVSYVNKDVRDVWPTVKSFLSDASLDIIEVDDEPRVAKAKIDGASVTVAVEAYDVDKSMMRVSARRFGVNDGEMAGIIMERIHRRLR